jgi:hypothetical protein
MHGEISLAVGCEVEGLQESFGGESLGSLVLDTNAFVSTGQTLDVQLESLRLKERQTVPLGLLEIRARSSPRAPLEANLDLEGKAGRDRRALAAEFAAAARAGPLQDLSLRNLFYWDRDDEGARTSQDLLYLNWRPRLSAGGWRLRLRGALDLSHTDESYLEIPSETTEAGGSDTTAATWLGFLNYRKLGLRIELARPGLTSHSLAVDLSQKWVAEEGSGCYQAAALLLNQNWFYPGGMLDIDADLRRRYYNKPTSVLSSFWEGELRGRWMADRRVLQFESDLTLNGILHDRSATTDEALGTLEGDRLRISAALLAHRVLTGGTFAAEEGRVLDELRIGAGPTGELLLFKDAEGDARALGGRIEVSARGGARGRSAWWLECSCEAGRRNYRRGDQATRLILEGYSLSLAQSDYTYAMVSVLGGGALPLAFEWEGYLSLDQEWHEVADDDAKLVSFSLALKRRWSRAIP